MNHYETLGIGRDATPEQIKKAHRKLSSRNHPDKGGDGERMAAINSANDVLSDPARRAAYDASGSDTLPPSVDVLARETLMRYVTAAMDGPSDDWLDAARRLLHQQESTTEAQLRQLWSAHKRLSRQRERFTVKEGENVVHMLVDWKLSQIDSQLEKGEEQLKLLKLALEMLENYGCVGGENLAPRMVAFAWGDYSGSTR